jgi:pimeloyl-ACP methyl ester carboxylesterase
MPLDQALLESYRSFRDERLGFSERFVQLEVGDSWTLGVLSSPVGPTRPFGWLICHSFGNEQVDLAPSETAIARGLASSGFQVLRFHCRGYGDAGDIGTPPGPGTQVLDTLDAVRQLREMTGVQALGAVGARFGGAVALLAAERAGLSRLILVSPVTDGRRYMTELLRFQRMGELAAGQKGTVEDLRSGLLHQGWVNVQGWELHRHVYEEFQRFDLAAQLPRFEGRALILQVSSGDRVQRPIAGLADRLGEAGASVEVRVVTDRAAPNFGYEHFRPVSATELEDSLTEINKALISAIVAWTAPAAHPDPQLGAPEGRGP